MIREKLAKLIDVKSIVTFAIVAGITYGFVIGTVQSETYAAFTGTVITYYFTRKKGAE